MSEASLADLTKRCTVCGEDVWIELFRKLSHGHRASMCRDCENAYDRQRRAASPTPSATDQQIQRWTYAAERQGLTLAEFAVEALDRAAAIVRPYRQRPR